jgi:hypothetical protein
MCKYLEAAWEGGWRMMWIGYESAGGEERRWERASLALLMMTAMTTTMSKRKNQPLFHTVAAESLLPPLFLQGHLLFGRETCGKWMGIVIRGQESP